MSRKSWEVNWLAGAPHRPSHRGEGRGERGEGGVPPYRPSVLPPEGGKSLDQKP